MKLLSKLLIIPAFILPLCFAAPVSADAKSDYEYQYSQYQEHYLEYTLLKKDYLDNPTLDNQQKAVLAAKDSLYARDLAKASYAEYLLNLIAASKVSYTPINPLIESLTAAKNYFSNEALKSQSIVTAADLKNFSADYVVNSPAHDRSFRTGVVAYKIAKLVRFQIDLKDSLDIILPKLATPFSSALQNRIDELQSKGNDINSQIETFTNDLYTEEGVQEIDNENFFSERSETIKKIQSLQIKWIDSLIDIDLNYAHS